MDLKPLIRRFLSLVIVFLALPALAQTARADPDRLASSEITRGDKQIVAAWLVFPTECYQHFVLGRRVEAGGFRVQKTDGSILTLELPPGYVFEDRFPRLADLDDDGDDEVILVLSSVAQGAALAIYDVTDDISLLAQTPHIGRANRWLNPAAIADLTGDGRLDIALVQMPHLVKRLELWTLQEEELRRRAVIEGVSTHQIGSTQTRLFAVHDANHDGVSDLIVPDADRSRLRLLSFAGGVPTELGQIGLTGVASGDFSVIGGELRVPLNDGRIERIDLP